MRNQLIGFLFLMAVLYGCSFNKMFMHPQKLEVQDFRLTYVDAHSKDTMQLLLDHTMTPMFTTQNGNLFTYPFRIESHFFKNEKDDQLQGWHMIPASGKDNKINILFLHGNAGSILSHFLIAKPLVEQGFHVFIFDYSGFGISEGKAKRKKLPQDARAALETFLSIESIKGNKTIIYGQSLGGHLAITVAEENQDKINGLVIEGAFTNHDEIGSYAFKPGFIAKMMIREFYNGLKNIRKLKMQVMVIHSVNDETIPYFMGEKLFATANEPKQFYQLEKCHVCGPIHYSDSIKVKIERMLK